jgi:hypothetical protein
MIVPPQARRGLRRHCCGSFAGRGSGLGEVSRGGSAHALVLARSLTPGASTNDIASHAIVHAEGGRAAAVISAIALVFSAYSLWATSLKQAELSTYITGVITL